MSGEPKVFRINPDNRESESITEVEFARLGFQERRDIQEWVSANPGILGEDLLIIGKEFSGFDRTNERLDLLAVDWYGKLVIIELKRDDTGADAHWQAIKYASYLCHATADDIVGMLASYKQISKSEAASQLLQHLQADDFTSLNHGQRIILASHRFAPEVTSAVLWLNEKAPNENLITCVQLVPYHDPQQDALYVLASTIIPLPGKDEYIVKLGDTVLEHSGASSSFAVNLKRAYDRNRDDTVTHFLKQVGDSVIAGLPDGIKPDRRSRWAGRHSNQVGRYYHLWYSTPPWHNWRMSYRVNLYPQGEAGEWQAYVEFSHDRDGLDNLLESNATYELLPHGKDQQIFPYGVEVKVGNDVLSDSFSGLISATMRGFIEAITPVVDDFVEGEHYEEEV